jgi:glutathione S-transferase
MPLTLYAHPFASYCWKVTIALYENDAPFTFRVVDLGDATSAAEQERLWLFKKIPVLVDGEKSVIESTIIIEYLDLADQRCFATRAASHHSWSRIRAPQMFVRARPTKFRSRECSRPS